MSDVIAGIIEIEEKWEEFISVLHKHGLDMVDKSLDACLAIKRTGTKETIGFILGDGEITWE